ncbi:YeiH family protein [Eubacterium pyruvativorans]|uniref:YeiH family protein n=1 Tax=Eubacterium pyruvativorans TaxID=155865 RepID=UPI000E8C0556|nr:YeiH family protein [Eubacterium pyruvativorans]MDD6707236.1 YeiH family protein [Eubacterium pyruvativorans]MDD7684220.1 YeiH family protein [Eubacterium pyruvativorans]HAT82702.1 putative sulfate exporter family transporter [Eubacterium sp.]
MDFLKKNGAGLLVCFLIAVPSWLLGKKFPIVGGAVIAILLGMMITLVWKEKGGAQPGIKWTSKIILQSAVVLLGFGMNLNVVLQTGKESLPIIVCTITTSLVIAWVLHRVMHIHGNTATLIGVGSSICGGSAIAAAAPVVGADDNEVAQSISVIFFFNVLAAIFFPMLGHALGFTTTDGSAFGVFAGTAINDTSSVTAAAATWDSMWNLGSATLDKAVTVKLTRTLAIIPITLGLALYRARGEKQAEGPEQKSGGFSLKRAFPMFLLYFVIASVITTVCTSMGVPAAVFAPLKELSKFFIVMAMAAIGLSSNVVELIRSGGKPILLGACCWAGITVVSLLMQHVMGIW